MGTLVKMALPSPKLQFNNGEQCPQFGLGTWLSDKGKVRDAVEHAISVGYRHIDAAWVYGNEGEVGEAIEASINKGVVKREELFIATKLWNTFHKPEDVVKGCDKSLANLRVKQIDLYLMHFPIPFKGDENFKAMVDETDPREKKRHATEPIDYVDTWKAMEELVKSGKVKSIGVSNFNEYQLNRLMKECTIKPVNNQVEVHPYLTNEPLVDFCQSNGITVTAYSPLGNPSKPVTRAWSGDEITILEEPIIANLAKKYGVEPAQILIRFGLDRGINVIPKSVTPARIESNSKVFGFKLTADEVATIKSMNKNFRIVELPQNLDILYYPFKVPYTE